MSASEKPTGEKPAGKKTYSGPIAWMVHNPVAANLLMVLIVAGGVVGIFSVKQEVFPSFDMDMINISVIYPGASPAEVEQGIVLAVEEAVRGVEGVKRITSSAREGLGSITMELYLDADKDRALADTKSAVDRILTFPKDAERPIVSIPSKKRQVVSVIVAGDQDRRSLHDLAEKVRERLLAQKDITQVDLEGVPPLEVGIEISQENLDAQSLSLDQVALAVRKSSLELPGGGVKTSSGEVLVRISDRKRKGHEFRDVVVKSGAGGNVLLLGDIATITDGYAETDQESRYNGQSAVRVTVFRVGKETPKAVAAATRKVVQDIRPDIPQNIQLVVWNDQSEILSARIQLLAKNGMSGLVLVFIVLALVMNFSLSFWVALGIPISFMGAFMFIPMGDQSINMISLFAFIVTLGMVVDDAIVIGENIHSKREKGIPPVQAAIEGAQELAVPVFFSVFTTMVAFSPLFFVPGIMGKIFYVIPFVVISVLMISLVESFFVLPAHLSHAPADPSKSGKVMQTIHFLQGKVSAWLDKFIQNTYRPTLIFALKNKAIAFTAGIGTFVIAIALLVGGQVPFYFFPDIEADIVTVTARFPYGTPLEKTQAAQIVLEDAAQKTIAGNGGEEILVGIYTRMGEGRGSRMGPVEVGANIMTIEVALVPGDDREITAEGFTAEWSENTPPIPGIKALNFIFSTGPGGGSPVDVQLSHFDTQTLADASENLSETLRSYATLIDVESTWSEGKSQLDFHILPEAKNVGLTADDIARQLRASFYGSEAIREQRGRNELKVLVRLPKDQRQSEYNIEELLIHAPNGSKIPLSQLARFDRKLSPTTISRESGKKVVNVSAQLAHGVDSARDVIDSLQSGKLDELKAAYPGLGVSLVGMQREMNDSVGALLKGFALAMLIIFALLAIPFKSYLQPIIIMSVVPFGFVGAVFGHLVMGYSLSIMSLFGIVALSGVVINDSLVLIDATNKKRAEGVSAMDAVIYGGMRRFRPILLTSLTTFLGLAPMIMETSIQAQFLIPMALSLGFGILFATFIVLLLVPVLYLVIEDLRAFLNKSSKIETAVKVSASI